MADPQAGSPACPDNILVAIPGTTETNEQADPTVPVGMLRSVVDPLESEFSAQQLQTYTVPYVATIVNDKAQTYGTSKKEAIDRASQHIADKAAECPGTKFGLTGFSQGADAAGDLASKIGHGTGPISADRMFAVGLLADPGQTLTPGSNSEPRPQALVSSALDRKGSARSTTSPPTSAIPKTPTATPPTTRSPRSSSANWARRSTPPTPPPPSLEWSPRCSDSTANR
ncbi:hypothetical protein BJF84_24355 [Rhodococcus sp. CUA-806]|nr:hypothetical protein BJF84_24355 [Rhodococcus sp. CUA-806]